jgi:nitrite reductase/ring-hydroxylating ferredoxin subunit
VRKPMVGNEPVLADGTLVSSLIDREKREISLRALSDSSLYDLELEHLWAKAWVLLGHESELPRAGDYVTRQVGEDMVILVRQRDGSVACLLNVCPHRGMQVCRADKGNAAAFRCIYHGWIFNQDGGFRGAPFNDQMYEDGFDAKERALRKARVELFGGLIFVNWSDTSPSLTEFLGEMGSYLKLIFQRTERGFEILGAPQRYTIAGNWKAAAEQAVGDGYHSQTLHRCLADYGMLGQKANDSRSWGLHNYKVSANGHGLICLDLRDIYNGMAASSGTELSTLDKLRAAPPSGLPPELVDEFVRRNSEEDLRAFADAPPSVGAIFPNVHVIAFHSPDPAGGLAGTFGIHTFVPKGPNEFEFIHWNFIERGASTEFREKSMRASIFGLGASGVVEQDDSEVWPGMQRSTRGYLGKQLMMKYHAHSEPSRPEGWRGGGNVYSGFSKDDNQWNWWNQYFLYMTGKLPGVNHGR